MQWQINFLDWKLSIINGHIGFGYLYDIQANVLDRQLVEKIVLGTDTSEDHAPGQILASYAFASFCHPNETVSVESIANDGGNLYNLAITENIEYIRDTVGLKEVSPQLREMAKVRLDNPDASLKELGMLLSPPVGKSGVNHRLRKLSEFATQLREG